MINGFAREDNYSWCSFMQWDIFVISM